MASRRFAGFVSAFYNPLQVPDAPTGVSASAAADGNATISFAAPTNTGGGSITGYGAVAIGTNVSSTNTSSPITLSGLTNGTTYTIGVWALNSYGPSPFGTSGSVTPTATLALIGGGNISSVGDNNVISYVAVGTLGNATDFGDLVNATWGLSAFGSSTRSIFAGGYYARTFISYVTPPTTGNAVDWGALSASQHNGSTGANSTTRGLIMCGESSSAFIDFVTIATTGSVSSFGTLSTSVNYGGSTFSSTRAIANLSTTGSPTVSCEYVTIATTGNGTTFGNLTASREGAQGCSNGVRGVMAGGNLVNIIEYATIATTGNFTDFGDLLSSVGYTASTSSPTRGLFMGGFNNVVVSNVIQYITIASTGNAIDFGDLTVLTSAGAATSTNNGGLQ
jgi:large repetitive protein